MPVVKEVLTTYGTFIEINLAIWQLLVLQYSYKLYKHQFVSFLSLRIEER